MYWRIVRINGDGSVRLIYDGIELVENGTTHAATIKPANYNANYSDKKYIGYTYDNGSGAQVDSTVKDIVDDWYEKNLKENFETYIADGIFCNDRSGEKIEGEDFWNYISYAPQQRYNPNSKPVLTCTNKEDRYTVNDTINGNGYLTNPVGLLTRDESIFAGFSNKISSFDAKTYLYSNEPYWTMTPESFEEEEAYVYYEGIHGSPFAEYYQLRGETGVRPVINIKSDVLFEGNGTIGSPYKINLSN